MMKVFIEAESGSPDKFDYNETTLEFQKIRRAAAPYPYPYGFILGTITPEGDGIDCYVISKSYLKAGSSVECEAMGMLEFFEGDEIDHKVLAYLPEEAASQPIDAAQREELRSELEKFIYHIFTRYPEMQVRVGRLLPQKSALDYIKQHNKMG